MHHLSLITSLLLPSPLPFSFASYFLMLLAVSRIILFCGVIQSIVSIPDAHAFLLLVVWSPPRSCLWSLPFHSLQLLKVLLQYLYEDLNKLIATNANNNLLVDKKPNTSKLLKQIQWSQSHSTSAEKQKSNSNLLYLVVHFAEKHVNSHLILSPLEAVKHSKYQLLTIRIQPPPLLRWRWWVLESEHLDHGATWAVWSCDTAGFKQREISHHSRDGTWWHSQEKERSIDSWN